MPQAFFHILASHARSRGDREALRLIDSRGQTQQVLTYGDLWGLVVDTSRDLTQRTPADAVLMLCLPNSIQYIIGFLSTLYAGRTVFPVHPALSETERTQAAQATGARIGTFPWDRLNIPANGSHLSSTGAMQTENLSTRGGLLLLSSGTTGLPRIVRRESSSLDAVAHQTAAAIGLRADDRVLAVIPQCHSYGIENAMLAPLWAGAAIHVCQTFDPAVVLRQWRNGVTVMPGVPFMFEMLTGAGERSDAGTLRRVYSAGAMLPPSVFSAFGDRYGLAIGQLYGATEIGSVTFSDPSRPHFDAASVGFPMQGVDIRILDPQDARSGRCAATGQEGHVAVKALSMMSGYIGHSADESIADGYFLTGDLGRLDEHGTLAITGRLKLLIDIGGMKVNPLEVEAVLSEHPMVGQCIVAPLPVTSTLVRLKAYLTPRTAGGAVDVEDVRRFARQRLAGYKLPRHFQVLEALPRSPLGKVARPALWKDAADTTAQEISPA